MSNQQKILNLLSQGKTIRRRDGRCGSEGYVDKQALENLINAGIVKVFVKGEEEYVKIGGLTK